MVWFAPGEKHWHGAAPAHIAIQEQLDGRMVDWLEEVSDEQYNARWSHETRNGNAETHTREQ